MPLDLAGCPRKALDIIAPRLWLLLRPNSYIHVVVRVHAPATYAGHGWPSAVKNRMFENGPVVLDHKKAPHCGAFNLTQTSLSISVVPVVLAPELDEGGCVAAVAVVPPEPVHKEQGRHNHHHKVRHKVRHKA